MIKMVELQRVEQESKIIEEFIQKFRKAAKEYEGRPLIEEFKREMNEVIR